MGRYATASLVRSVVLAVTSGLLWWWWSARLSEHRNIGAGVVFLFAIIISIVAFMSIIFTIAELTIQPEPYVNIEPCKQYIGCTTSWCLQCRHSRSYGGKCGICNQPRGVFTGAPLGQGEVVHSCDRGSG